MLKRDFDGKERDELEKVIGKIDPDVDIFLLTLPWGFFLLCIGILILTLMST